MDSSKRRALQTNGHLFSNFEFVFDLLAEKRKNIRTNREAWILIRVQCFIYQWIRLDMLYKAMKAFFQISESFFELTYFFLNNSSVGFMHARRGGGICADQHAF